MIKPFLLNQLNNLIKELIMPRANMQISCNKFFPGLNTNGIDLLQDIPG